MAKVEQIIQRKDGSEVRIVAEACFGTGDALSIGAYVLRRETAGHAWQLMGDRSHPDWRNMSVDDYVKHGRSEMLQTVTVGEILKVTSTLHASLGV